MPIDFYYTLISPPCRTVMLAAKALNVDLNLKVVDLAKGEHTTPKFLKLNPQHAVPTLVDNGFALSESRAIIMYLANKYGKGSPLYPSDPQERALVDHRLFFDSNCLCQRFADYTFPQVFAGAPADENKRKQVYESLEYLETFLGQNKFVAGPHLTLADLSIIVSLSGFYTMDIDIFKYPKIKAWFESTKKSIPGYEEINENGMKQSEQFYKMLLKK